MPMLNPYERTPLQKVVRFIRRSARYVVIFPMAFYAAVTMQLPKESNAMTIAPNFYRYRAPFTGTTVTEISVPSGKLIASDDLRTVPYFDVEAPNSINYGAGRDEWSRLYAEQAQVAQAQVGNTCPFVTRQVDGSLLVVATDLDEDTDEAVLLNDERVVAHICTDLWSTMLTDYEHWLSQGGGVVEPTIGPITTYDQYTLIDVTPGMYRWTVFSNDDGFDMNRDGRIEFAKLELIRAY